MKDAEVRIVPPYKPDNIKGDPKAIDHIKKVVSIFSCPIRSKEVISNLIRMPLAAAILTVVTFFIKLWKFYWFA